MIESGWTEKLTREDVRRVAAGAIEFAFDDLDRATLHLRRLQRIARRDRKPETIRDAIDSVFNIGSDLRFFTSPRYAFFVACLAMESPIAGEIAEEYSKRAQPVARELDVELRRSAGKKYRKAIEKRRFQNSERLHNRAVA